jgi:hypothetical protein
MGRGLGTGDELYEAAPRPPQRPIHPVGEDWGAAPGAANRQIL